MITEIEKKLEQRETRRAVILNVTEKIKQNQNLIIETDDKGNTLLHYMAKCDEAEDLIRLLVQRGADLKAKNMDGDTALHIAAAYSVKNSILLMQLGAKDNVINNDLLLPEDVFHKHFSGSSWFDIMPAPKVIFKGSHYEIVSSCNCVKGR